MCELKELINKIEEMKKYLARLIELKQDLVDPDVIAVSKMLDIVLNDYNELIKKSDTKKRA